MGVATFIENGKETPCAQQYIYQSPKFITIGELSRIEDKELPIARLAQVRDLFVFSCYTFIRAGSYARRHCRERRPPVYQTRAHQNRQQVGHAAFESLRPAGHLTFSTHINVPALFTVS
jgi:hypothetical protein